MSQIDRSNCSYILELREFNFLKLTTNLLLQKDFCIFTAWKPPQLIFYNNLEKDICMLRPTVP